MQLNGHADLSTLRMNVYVHNREVLVERGVIIGATEDCRLLGTLHYAHAPKVTFRSAEI